MDLYDEIEAQKKSEIQFKEVFNNKVLWQFQLATSIYLLTQRFHQSLIQEVMKLHADSKLRFSTDGLQAMNEVIRSFTLEAVWRSGNQAYNEGLTNVTIDHLEKILPQLVWTCFYSFYQMINQCISIYQMLDFA